VSGEYAYLARTSELQILYVGPSPRLPAARILEERHRTARGITVPGAGIYGYVPMGRTGVAVVDLADPLAPVEVGEVETPGFARRLDVADRIAAVADGEAGLSLLDVSDPRSPSLAGTMLTGGPATDVKRTGDYALVACGDLEVVRVDEPEAPSLAARALTPGEAHGVTLAGDRAYVADGASGLLIVDVRDPANPETLGRIDTPGFAYQVAVDGRYAFVADGPAGLGIVDIGAADRPLPVTSVETPGEARAVSIHGSYVYVADGPAQSVLVIDAGDPEFPVLVDLIRTRSVLEDVVVLDGHAYLVDGSLRVIPLNPTPGEVSSPSDDIVTFTVPAGFAPGAYHVLTAKRGHRPARLRNAYRVCHRRELEAVLEPRDPPASPELPRVPVSWLLAVDGDDLFFLPEPRHEAALRLPELPPELEVRHEAGDGSGRVVVWLELAPDLDTGLVRLVADDAAGAEALWETIRTSGEIPLPLLDDHHYGDMILESHPIEGGSHEDWRAVGDSAGNGLATGQAPIRYRYDLVDGDLVEARAWGPGVDLLFEARAEDDLSCRFGNRISFNEALQALCDEAASEHPGLVLACAGR
jgi:hypothetical protein